ncbi:MAG TPA: hypothetical protein VI727_01950, partial [Candidatus Brocadiaceae bacterium]|nr:hypothetical protein [Candidatus Brocadiaceae bacterium]
CVVKKERFYREIGNFIIHFGPSDRREGVICYGDEEVWNFCKDVKRSKQETGSSTSKEDRKEIINIFSTIQKLASTDIIHTKICT